MHYIRQHIHAIIVAYHGDIPLAYFLKNYFRQYPKLGSRDRKILSALAYGWYRCSKAVGNEEWLDTLTSAIFKDHRKWLDSPITDWLHEFSIPYSIDAIFPYHMQFSDGMNEKEWLQSMLNQPELFIRVIRNKKNIVNKLTANNIPFREITGTCIALANGTKVDTLLPADSYVVQDASSQQTGTFFKPVEHEEWYDCCAGAGGKSLLLRSLAPDISLTVSDKRASIIHNLLQRFRQYDYAMPAVHVTDVADAEQLGKSLGSARFEHIICDAPCSGSGTWARTPEQLYFFDPLSVAKYSTLQQQIAINVSKYLKPGGKLIYITCSVFKQENEDVVLKITKQTGLKVLQSQLINGISNHADSMFVAVLGRA